MNPAIDRLFKIAATELAQTDNTMYVPADVQLNFIKASLARAEEILDTKRDGVFADLLDINSTAIAERAGRAYTADFLLSMKLSIDSTIELAKALVDLIEKYKVQPNFSLKNLSKGKFTFEEQHPADTDVDTSVNSEYPTPRTQL